MPVLTLYRHGSTLGVPPMKNSHRRAPRGEVSGWTAGATRRNTQFLYSVREDQLDGVGFAVTLTLRDCPPTPTDWHRLRRAWEKRMKRAGMLRLHWVTEWQRRGVPHLHGAIWFPQELVDRVGFRNVCAYPINAWWFLASQYGAGLKGQQSHLITGAVGWFQYLSKHAARGVKHYQRSSENIPEPWQSKTGRMWGKVGHWPVQERIQLSLQGPDGDGGFFAYRRLVRSWRVADARASGDPRRLRLARSMLKAHDRALSQVRGVSEWIEQDSTLRLLAHLASRGYAIDHHQTAGQAERIRREAEMLADAEWTERHA